MKIFDTCPICQSKMMEQATCPNYCCFYYTDGSGTKIYSLYITINKDITARFVIEDCFGEFYSWNKEYDVLGEHTCTFTYFEPNLDNINQTISKLKNILLLS